MQTFNTELRADGTADRRIIAAPDALAAAYQAIKAWRSDAKFDTCRIEHAHTHGGKRTQLSFTFRGPIRSRDIAVVKIWEA